MSTSAQVQANRENATRSTGPRTEAGKAVSSRNHLVHGLCSTDPVLPTEDRNLFNELLEKIKTEWQPQTPHLEFLVFEMACAAWKLERIHRIEKGMLEKLDDHEKLYTDKETAAAFARLERHRANLQRTYHRCTRAIETWQKNQRQFEAKNARAIEKERLDFVIARNEQALPENYQELLDQAYRNYRARADAQTAAAKKSTV